MSNKIIFHKSHYLEYEGDEQRYDINPTYGLIHPLVSQEKMLKEKQKLENKGFVVEIQNKLEPTDFHPSKVQELVDYGVSDFSNYIYNIVVMTTEDEIIGLSAYGYQLCDYFKYKKEEIPDDLSFFIK